MTNRPRFDRSAEVQEWLQLAPELVAQFHEVRLVNDEPPETIEGLSWFVVLTSPKGERKAQLGLPRAGYQTYLPESRRRVIYTKKKEAKGYPLFPRYLFIGRCPGQDFYYMRDVDGAEGIVRSNRVPVEVSAGLLPRLREREASGEFDFTLLPEIGLSTDPA
jgi:hypothetical protein